MYNNWINAYNSFNWVGNLTNYKEKDSYPDHFKLRIDRNNLHLLDERFQNAVNNYESQFDGRIVAGEIYYWNLNYISNIDEKTSKLINDLSYKNQQGAPIAWNKFARSLSSLSREPTVENFTAFIDACNMSFGYSVPITFLDLYNPTEYPVVDKRTATWWRDNKERFGYDEAPDFIVSENGAISGYIYHRESNWNAYLHWANFCKDYAKKLTDHTHINWNAQMVEMAVRASSSSRMLLEPFGGQEEISEEIPCSDEIRNDLSSDENILNKSPVLILAIDSFHKKMGGSAEYNDEDTLRHFLRNETVGTKLLETRGEIFSQLSERKIHWENCEQEAKEYNQNLVKGKDFGGDAPAQYLPAIERFDGQFYTALGEDGRSGLIHSSHHFLIMSACYGLLSPQEPIQNYACQFGNKNGAYWLWTKSKFITDILIEYIKQHNIERIFDFTYCDVISYHFAIDWQYLKEKTPVEVIHCYHSLAEGDKALRYFGNFIKEHLMYQEATELLEMGLGTIDNVVLSSKREVKDPDTSPDITVQDLIGYGEGEKIEFKRGAFRSAKYHGEWGFSEYFGLDNPFEKNNSMYLIAKTIVGFLNKNGGDLLIGVEELKKQGDRSQPSGITREYDKLNDKNLDGYKRKIIDDIIKPMIFPRDIVNHFNKYLNISFEEIDDETVCWIRVKKSDIPFYAVARYSNGKKKEHFYVRTESETVEIYFKNTGDYILKHFCNRE